MASPTVSEWHEQQQRKDDPDYDNKRKKHCIINYDIATDNKDKEAEERDDFKDFIDDHDGVQLSQSCYLVRSDLDHHRILDLLKDHANQESDKLSVTPLEVFDCQGELARPLAPHGDDLLNDPQLQKYHYLVDPRYSKKE